MTLARRVDADSTSSTARRRNNARGILLDALRHRSGKVESVFELSCSEHIGIRQNSPLAIESWQDSVTLRFYKLIIKLGCAMVLFLRFRKIPLGVKTNSRILKGGEP